MQHAGTGTRPAVRVGAGRHVGGWILVGVAGLVVVAAAAYLLYVGAESSSRLAAPYASQACTRPSDAPYGWSYEAINYDPALDALPACTPVGAHAGTQVVAADGTPIAGWYIPSATPGDARPTILLVHGHDANKSVMLPIAAALHDAFDLVVVDLRATGYSGGTSQTMGALETQDVAAILDWLVETKSPTSIAALGVSAGADAVMAVAADDERIDAVIADSMHARIETLLAQELENARQPAYPGTWATIVGTWIRTGQDVTARDPIDQLALLGDRPLLLLHGTADTEDVPADSVDLNWEMARDLGLDVTRHDCVGAEHAGVITTCAGEYGGWVSDFLGAASGS